MNEDCYSVKSICYLYSTLLLSYVYTYESIGGPETETFNSYYNIIYDSQLATLQITIASMLATY